MNLTSNERSVNLTYANDLTPDELKIQLAKMNRMFGANPNYKTSFEYQDKVLKLSIVGRHTISDSLMNINAMNLATVFNRSVNRNMLRFISHTTKNRGKLGIKQVRR